MSDGPYILRAGDATSGTSLPGIAILNVRHESRVAAVSTAAGAERLLERGLAEALGAAGLPVRVTEVSPPRTDVPGEVAASFAVADSVSRHVRDVLGRDRLAVVLSGSCHTALGSVAGIPEAAPGVLWLDCHGDFNTPESTESGLLDGTTLASITGRCWRRLCAGVAGFSPVPDDDVVLVGARSLDAGEAALLEESSLTVIPPSEALTRGPDALRALGERVGGVYLHIDLDVLDPSVGRANAFVTEGGLTRGDLRALVGIAADQCPVRAVGFASYDPASDEAGTVCETAVEVAGALAERVRAYGG